MLRRLKQAVRRSLLTYLPRILRRLGVNERKEIFGKSMTERNFYESLSRSGKLQHFLSLARSLDIRSFAVEGQLGVFEGSPEDRDVFGQYVLNQTWSPQLKELVVKHAFRNGSGTYVDVGANIGLTVLPVAAETNALCIAFEPEPETYQYLCKNLITNGLDKRVTTHNVALFSEEAIVELELGGRNKGDHRIRFQASGAGQVDAFKESSRRVVRVRGCRLDDIVSAQTLPRPVVCKVDTQGAEVHVLRGATQFLRVVDLLVAEFWPYGLARAGMGVTEFLDIIRGFEYGALLKFDAEERAELPNQLMPIAVLEQELREISGNLSGTNYCDVILVPRTSVSGFPFFNPPR